MSEPVLDWQGKQGSAWAAEWKRTDRSFLVVTEKLLATSRQFRFSTALDVGCGAGELSLALARGRPSISVIGVDISPPLIAAAKARAGNYSSIEFECGDVADWHPPAQFVPDLVVSRHGVMFFENPVAAFRNMAEFSVEGAGLLFSCFRAPKYNPFFTAVSTLLPSPQNDPNPEAPGPFAFANEQRTRGILEESGWTDLVFEPFDCAMVVGAGASPVEDAVAYFSKIGPAARHAADLGDTERAKFLERVRGLARDNLRDGIVSLRAGMWVVTGRRS